MNAYLSVAQGSQIHFGVTKMFVHVWCLVCMRYVHLTHAVFQLTLHLLPVPHETPYAGKAFKVSLKGIVHAEIKILLFIHPHVVETCV